MFPWKRVVVALVLFGTAFGYVEAAVVTYLRALHEPVVQRYYPGRKSGDLFPLLTLDQLRTGAPEQMKTLATELGREVATIAMLAGIALAVARNSGQWAAAFVIVFGVWDITFYAFLKVLVEWPQSLFTWDILFLVPVPWTGPVLAPVLVSAAMIGAGVWHLRCEASGDPVRCGGLHWTGMLGGAFVIVIAFAMDYRTIMAGGQPNPFHWGVFGLGLGLGLASYARAAMARSVRVPSAMLQRIGLFLLGCAAVLGQNPQLDPFNVAVQSYHEAHSRGDFETAVARREDVRSLMAKTAIDSPQFISHVMSAANLYRSSGRTAESRHILQDALAKTDSLPAGHPIRIQLLQQLGEAWQQDGNLLRAVSYWEKAVSAQDAAPAPSATDPPPQVTFSRLSGAYAVGPRGIDTYPYQRLGNLYRELGRPEAAAQMLANLREKLQDSPQALASSYQQEGEIDKAIAIYQQQAEQATDPQVRGQALQSVANLYRQEGQFPEAAAALAHAIGAPGTQEMPYLRLQLAQTLQQAGQTQAADQAYQAALSQSTPEYHQQALQQYANHLAQTSRGAQAEDLLKASLANAGNPDGQLYQSLAMAARSAGHPERAMEYQRAAEERNRALQPPASAQRNQVGPEFNQAQTAVNQGYVEEAFQKGMRAIAAASTASDRDQISWQVAGLANALASHKAPEKGEALHRSYLALVESTSTDQLSPLIAAQMQYARFLSQQADFRSQAAVAVDRYRESLVAAQGEGSGAMAQVWNLRVEIAHTLQDELQSAEELVRAEEALSGTTSRPYLRAIQRLATAHRAVGNTDRALALDRQAIHLADLSAAPNDFQRISVRTTAANSLAALQRFDEAEQVDAEALAIARQMHPPQEQQVTNQIENIRRQQAAVRTIVH